MSESIDAQLSRDGFVLNASPDAPDIRDRLYLPGLIPVPDQHEPDYTAIAVRHQGSEGACTGFGLAASINLQNAEKNPDGVAEVSPRMLYEMAKRFDEWTGEDYSGSSIRGALRGFYNNGVCDESDWPYRIDRPGTLTLERARAARKTSLGAYYRVEPDITHMHTALIDARVLYVSARVHPGWDRPVNGIIQEKPLYENGGHAFAVVGYTQDGFIVQNSWGPEWGDGGFALWTYADWSRSISDAWVFRLGASTPSAFDLRIRSTFAGGTVSEAQARAPRRSEIAGHFVHLDDGKFEERGRYSTQRTDIEETFRYLSGETAQFKHVLFYCHGGLNSPKASASRIHAMKDTFKANGIYPFHFMYDTGLAEELKDVIFRRSGDAGDRAGGFSDWTDKIIEKLSRRLGTVVWEEMKSGARNGFQTSGDGTTVLKIFMREMAAENISLHMIGHSTGAILLGHLLDRMAKLSDWRLPVSTCSLFAPAARTEFYDQAFAPRIKGASARAGEIKSAAIYALTDEQERDDTVTPLYRKSLLYLVSNAFERMEKAPIVGMETFRAAADLSKTEMLLSGRRPVHTESKTHGGFDNDVKTMNDALARILGGPPVKKFTKEILDY